MNICVSDAMKTSTLWLLASFALLSPVSAQTPATPAPAPAPKIAPAQGNYPKPPSPSDPDRLGQGVQRTMTLLATSTPTHHNTVRILFYGQSITEQDWSRQVADDLRRRFPNADLQIENRAIGGFASQILGRPAEHDLYPFYPDLLIFHVYGGNNEYAEIIQNVRTRTASEVLMQLDHATFWPLGTPEAAAHAVKEDGGTRWDRLMNTAYLPDIARRYGCGLADVRGGWLDYLRANRLEPPALLQDGVHLNAWGNFVMARLIERHLVYRPGLPKIGWQGLSQTFALGKDLKPRAGRLTLAFTGNRLDALPTLSRHAAAASCRVLIDGRPPSQDDLYAVTRPQSGPWSTLALVRVDHDKPLQAEDWTLTVTSVRPDNLGWTYDVSGSKTGPDGSGGADAVFVSRSGRVRIDPKDFFRPPAGFHPAPVTVGYTIHWSVLPLSQDVYHPPAILDPTRDQAEVLAQGLPNGPHTLTLLSNGAGPPPIRALRVYTPPVAGGAPPKVNPVPLP